MSVRALQACSCANKIVVCCRGVRVCDYARVGNSTCVLFRSLPSEWGHIFFSSKLFVTSNKLLQPSVMFLLPQWLCVAATYNPKSGIHIVLDLWPIYGLIHKVFAGNSSDAREICPFNLPRGQDTPKIQYGMPKERTSSFSCFFL